MNQLSHYKSVQICAWDPQSDACQGDSGGPLTVHSRGVSYLIGVVSYGNEQCGHAELAGVYGRITRVMKWILANIQRGECSNTRRIKPRDTAKGRRTISDGRSY